jgi:hypothetical protein
MYVLKAHMLAVCCCDNAASQIKKTVLNYFVKIKDSYVVGVPCVSAK